MTDSPKERVQTVKLGDIVHNNEGEIGIILSEIYQRGRTTLEVAFHEGLRTCSFDELSPMLHGLRVEAIGFGFDHLPSAGTFGTYIHTGSNRPVPIKITWDDGNVSWCDPNSWHRLRRVLPQNRTTQTTETEPVKETPCIRCGRKNDVGVATCWCCGQPPT